MWEFRASNLRLNHPEGLPSIDGHPLAGLTFDELHDDLQKRFSKFIVSVTEIVKGSNDEITNLFSRLQMGIPLNPAELRNAILAPMRHVIDTIARSHEFFLNCRIPEARYKRLVCVKAVCVPPKPLGGKPYIASSSGVQVFTPVWIFHSKVPMRAACCANRSRSSLVRSASSARFLSVMSSTIAITSGDGCFLRREMLKLPQTNEPSRRK
jgi:hypothetical protein